MIGQAEAVAVILRTRAADGNEHQRRGLLDNGYFELPVTSSHAVAVLSLPPLHKDPFDRLLLAQAISEGFVLLTADTQLMRYPGPLRQV